MNTILRAQFKGLKFNSITNVWRTGAHLLAGIILLAALLVPRASQAACFAGSVTSPTNTSICGSGSTVITFHANTGVGADFSATYQWYFSSDNFFTESPIAGATGTITTASPDVTYTVTGTAGTTCSTAYYRLKLVGITSVCVGFGSGTHTGQTVTVSICPSAGTISGSNVVCVPSCITLTTTGTGGTWTSSNTTRATVGSASGIVCGVSAGTAIISYSTSAGCFATHIVTVGGNPGTISAPTYVCLGSCNPLTITGTTFPGTLTTSNPAILGICGASSNQVSGLSLGTAIITYTPPGSPGGACYSTRSIDVVDTPGAIIGGNIAFCSGTSVTLTSSMTGGTWLSTSPGCVNIAFVGYPGIANGTNTTALPCSVTIVYTRSGTTCSTTTTLTVNPLPTLSGYTGPICSGATVTLTPNVTGGTWVSGNTAVGTVSTGGVVTGIAAGTTGITYTAPSGCFRVQVVSVHPVPATIVTPGVVCVGSTIVASNSTSGGTFAIAPVTVATATTTNPSTIGGISAGTATLTYSIGATGCRTTTVITVNPLPAVTTGPTAVCVGSTITLNNASPGGTWTSGNTALATVGSTTGIVTGVSFTSGTGVAICYTLPTGCAYCYNVTVNPLPTFTPVGVCLGSSTTVTASPAGGTWASSDNTIGTIGASDGLFTGTGVGTVTVTYTAPTGCIRSGVMTVNPLPVISGTLTMCPGQCNTLSSSITGGTWASSNTAIATVGSSTGVVCGIATGTANITFTVTGTGCRSVAVATVNNAASAITGTTVICNGSCTTLFNTTPGGTWASSNTAIATVGSATGVVCGVSGGTATISYLLPSGCIASTVVTVNANPPAPTGTFTVCVGATTTLTNATTGGTWTSGNTFVATIGSASGIALGGNAGTSTITYTLPTGCFSTAVLTVNPIPGPITGTLVVCQGQTTALSNSASGGTWTSSNTGIATVSASSGVVTGGAAGTATITYTLPGSCFVTATVTVNPLPSVITGSTSMCVSSCVTLSTTSTGGTWTSSNTAVATAGSTSGVICGVAAGTATITYTFATTGCYTTTVVTVNNAPPAILGTLSACLGNTATLTHTSGGGTWTSSNTTVATINASTGVVTTLAEGTTTITYTLPGGCFTSSVFTVNALPAPINVGTGTVCVGSTLTVTDPTPGGTWSISPIIIATINSSTGVITGGSAGTATVTYTVTATGCFVTAVVTVNPPPAAISGSSFSMCIGNCVTLSSATTGGTWASGNTAVATAGVGTGIICGVAAGTANITYTATTGCRAIATVTVTPLPAAITGTLLLCPGTTTSLSSATTGGTWSVCGTGTGVVLINPATGLVTGIAEGTVTICYTVASGCSTSVELTINALPAPITGNMAICIGGTTTLSSATAGGTWLSSNTAVATVGSATGIVTGITAGTTTITYRLTATGCYVTAIVTVSAAPPAIGGSLTVCTGFTTALTNASTGGTWLSGNTTVGTIGSSSGVFSGLTVGTSIVTYTVSAGCAVTAIVTVNPTPEAITGTTVVCTGSTITVSSATAGGTWSSSNTAVATIGSTTGIIVGVASGTSVISYVMPTGCFVTTVITVNALPDPITGSTTICQGDSTTLSSTTAGGGTWSSSNTGIATVGSTTGVVVGVDAGTAVISFTSTTTGCITTTIVTVNPLPSPINGTLSLCEGTTTSLSNSTAGGTWSSSNTSVALISATGVVTGMSGGTSVITYTLGTGCFITAVVTVNPLPGAITGSLTGCAGVAVTLSSSSTGGTWTVTPTTTATIDPTTGVITGAAIGTATVTYTLSSGCFVTAVFTVTPAPGAIMGVAFLCVGGTTTLTDTSAGTWSSANTFIATVSSTGIVSGISAGTVAITFTAATGCYVTRIVSVYPIPTMFTGTMVICEGGTTTLSDITTGGTWTSASPFVATIGSASGIVTGILAGTTIITYTLPTGCFITGIVTVNPIPDTIAGQKHVCDGFTTTLTNAMSGGTWTSSDNSIATIGSTTGVVTGISPGTVTITYTISATGCFRTTTFTVDPIPPTISGTLRICVGTTTSLTNTITGGSWVSSNTAVGTIGSGTGVAGGISFGTTTITYTTAAGCVTTSVLTVDPLPAAITGMDTVCVGATATLTTTTSGGTWTSGNTSVATVGSTTGVITGVSVGTAVITYTITATGCYVTHIVTVHPNPPSITGINQICFGFTTTLSNPIPGGTWTSSNPSVGLIIFTTADRDSAVVRGDAVGSTTITYTLPTGCFQTAGVTVNPLPSAITGTPTVCVGSTTTLFNAAPGGSWISSNTGVATVGATSGVVTGISAGTAVITYRNTTTGCQSTLIVTVNPLPTAIFGPVRVCDGFSITLIDTTAGGTWSISDTSIATIDTATGVLTGQSAGVATVTYRLTATGCFVTRQITVDPIPNVTVNQPGIICRFSSVVLTATGAGAAGVYTWLPTTGLTCTTCPSTIATPTITTTYTVTGTTSFGCSDTATVRVVVDSLLNDIRITGQDSICAGTCTTLIAEGFPPGSLFAWRPIAGLSCTICDTVVACPDVTRTYWAIAIDSLGCSDSTSLTVHVMPLPVLDYYPRPAYVCEGGSTQLHAVSSVFGTTFAWFPNAFLSCDSCADPFASDTQNLVYRVIGITPFGCYDSIKVPVSILRPAINSISPDTVICRGAYVDLISNSINSDGSVSEYKWTPSDFLNNPNIPNPRSQPDRTITYSLIITPNPCFIDTLQVTIAVAEFPDITITPKDTNVIAGSPVTLTATVNNPEGIIITSYAWSPAIALSCIECYTTIATPTVTTTYTFSTVSNYGCASSATGTIHTACDNSQVFIPNTFTPNGDGNNDRFYISAKGVNRITRFSIYNRWGELVYEARNITPNDPAQGWDGTFKGMVLPPDVFVYIVDATCELGSPFSYKGDISIVR
ncbi:MAG: Ig-like domain-containing protein [Bacteroidota bacterium]